MTNSKKLPSESYCIIPWIHLNTWPNGNVFQCCITDFRNHIGNLKDNSMEEIWNNDYMRQLRLDLLDGKKPNSCSKCFEQEDMGIQSLRKSVNKNFKHHIDSTLATTTADGTNTEFKLAYWDFRFSNLCNMKCRMCGGHLSSIWNLDEKAIYGKASEPDIVVNTQNHSIDDMYGILDQQLENVEEIYFAGGEPLIMDEHYYILEKLIEHGRTDVRLRYNTNLLKIKYKKWDNHELWKHFDNVQVIASLDALAQRGEYIRKGTIWETVDKNMKTLIKNDHINFGISPTINLFNVQHVPEFVQYVLDCGFDIHKLHLNNVLTNPTWYHINILPNELKQDIKNKYNKHLDSISDQSTRDHLQQMYQSILIYLDSDMDNDKLYWNRKKFKTVTDTLDTYRKETLCDVFPELREFYEQIT